MKDAVVIAGGNRERGLRLSDKLANERYCVKFCQSFTDFCSTINQNKIAAVLLLFPDEFGVINQLFEKKKMPVVGRMPVVFISSSANENNIARSLHYQADEFLIEPILVEEIAKIIDDSIDSRLRSDREHILAIGDLVLNKETLIVTWRNKKLSLYPQQVRLLEFLMSNPKRPITRMELLNNIWNSDTYASVAGTTVSRQSSKVGARCGSTARRDLCIDSRTIDRNIKRIRDAFKGETKRDPIRTVRRVGYVFNDQFE